MFPSGAKVKEYKSISSSKMKEYISVSPLTVVFYASGYGFSSYSSGVYSGCPSGITSYDVDHAVELVGYDEEGNYIIKNSWGTSWGVSGFAVISKNRDCGMLLYSYQFVS